MTKKLHLLNNGDAVEEYKDGLCIECWIMIHKKDLERLSVMVHA